MAEVIRGRRVALTRRMAPWCLLLFAEAVAAHDDHTRHPAHPKAETVFLNMQQAIALGARRGPDAVRSRTSGASANALNAAAAPLVTQLPYVQTQVGPRLYRGNLSPEVVVSVNQPFTWGNTTGVQKRVARATLKTVDATTRSAQLLDARRAAEAWIALALADRVLELRQAFTDQAKSLVALARARVTAGEAQPMELALAEGELSEAESLVIDAEGAHYTAELELSYAIGRPGTHVDVDGALTSPPVANMDVSPTPHPEIAAAENRAALALEQVEYAKLQQAPTLALGLQYQREGTGDQILTAVATIPLPIAEPWAFQQTQQRMAADAARADANYTRLMNSKDLAEARHELEHTRSLHEHLERAGLPPLREAHRIALVRYSQGATDFADVSLIRQRLLRGEERVAAALAQAQGAHVQWLAASNTLVTHEAP
jgi:outer membrane protein TolC